jgi:hypothetical protein
MRAAHQRTRERFLALYEITQASCATQVAAHTQRHPQTVMKARAPGCGVAAVGKWPAGVTIKG